MNWAFIVDLGRSIASTLRSRASGDRADAGPPFVDFHPLALTDQHSRHAPPGAAPSRGEHKAGEAEGLQAANVRAQPSVIGAYTGFTDHALRMLRDGGHFQWSTVTLLGLVIYVYAVEIERQRWDIVLGGLAFWLMDWFNEIVNSVVLHVTGRAAIWTVTGSTSFLILIGLNVEISLLFLFSGVAFVKQLPAARHLRLLGVPNRWALVFGFSCFSVLVEILLHAVGVFHWEYWWWNVPFVPLIIVFGYMTFYGIAAWVYDMGANHGRQLTVVGTLAAIDALGLIIFGAIGWL